MTFKFNDYMELLKLKDTYIKNLKDQIPDFAKTLRQKGFSSEADTIDKIYSYIEKENWDDALVNTAEMINEMDKELLKDPYVKTNMEVVLESSLESIQLCNTVIIEMEKQDRNLDSNINKSAYRKQLISKYFK